MVLYGITLGLLAEDLRDADTTLLYLSYTDDAVFYGSERQSTAQLQLLMYRGPYRGYFPEPDKSLFIVDNS